MKHKENNYEEATDHADDRVGPRNCRDRPGQNVGRQDGGRQDGGRQEDQAKKGQMPAKTSDDMMKSDKMPEKMSDDKMKDMAPDGKVKK
jgi:hypothetical protein